jgi:hypothetical protein
LKSSARKIESESFLTPIIKGEDSKSSKVSIFSPTPVNDSKPLFNVVQSSSSGKNSEYENKENIMSHNIMKKDTK